MRPTSVLWILSAPIALVTPVLAVEQKPLLNSEEGSSHADASISPLLFDELEELARVVDISYCVGNTGVRPPFTCLGRCGDFPDFELVTTWNTGHLMSDSCGFIALDHRKTSPRLIVAFRGTYSITNTLIDLSTVPQEYLPYPDDGSGPEGSTSSKCIGCTVHSGFLTSWENTRDAIMDHIEATAAAYPDYKINLVGHSLGGAVALLGALELKARGWTPYVTTFGEPRVGNDAFVAHVNERLIDPDFLTYRRVTHVDDPVPLLPLTEWGYKPHGGEIYIAKKALPPTASDVRLCNGNADQACSAGADSSLIEHSKSASSLSLNGLSFDSFNPFDVQLTAETPLREAVSWSGFDTRLKLWQLFFSHRDYFWRLGICFQTWSTAD